MLTVFVFAGVCSSAAYLTVSNSKVHWRWTIVDAMFVDQNTVYLVSLLDKRQCLWFKLSVVLMFGCRLILFINKKSLAFVRCNSGTATSIYRLLCLAYFESFHITHPHSIQTSILVLDIRYWIVHLAFEHTTFTSSLFLLKQHRNKLMNFGLFIFVFWMKGNFPRWKCVLHATCMDRFTIFDFIGCVCRCRQFRMEI